MAGFPGDHSASQVAIVVSVKDRNFKCQFLEYPPHFQPESIVDFEQNIPDRP